MGQNGDVFLKCALDEVQSQGKAVETETDLNGKVSTNRLSCQDSCVVTKAKDEQPNATKAVLGMASESKASPIDYNRYCFYNCRPYDFTVGNICVNLGAEMKKRLKGEVDPAVHPKVTDPEVQEAWAIATGKSPPHAETTVTTTQSLPCEQSDPCAYGLMNRSIQDAKAYYKNAKDEAAQAESVAELAR